MHSPKSQRHVRAANARWRMQQADDERAAGIPDREQIEDCRQPFDLLLASAGYLDLRIEPRRGYVAWRAIDVATGQIVHCAALKELLRWIAGQLPRMLAARNFH